MLVHSRRKRTNKSRIQQYRRQHFTLNVDPHFPWDRRDCFSCATRATPVIEWSKHIFQIYHRYMASLENKFQTTPHSYRVRDASFTPFTCWNLYHTMIWRALPPRLSVNGLYSGAKPFKRQKQPSPARGEGTKESDSCRRHSYTFREAPPRGRMHTCIWHSTSNKYW